MQNKNNNFYGFHQPFSVNMFVLKTGVNSLHMHVYIQLSPDSAAFQIQFQYFVFFLHFLHKMMLSIFSQRNNYTRALYEGKIHNFYITFLSFFISQQRKAREKGSFLIHILSHFYIHIYTTTCKLYIVCFASVQYLPVFPCLYSTERRYFWVNKEQN